MGEGFPRQAEWGIGLGFIIGMVILLVIAIQVEGASTTILLIVAAVFLLVGLFFLTGTGRGRAEGADMEGEGGGSQQQSIVIGGMGGEPMKVSQGGSSRVLVVCPSCKNRVAETHNNCPRCGAPL